MNFLTEEKKGDKIWSTGLVNVGCVSEVFDFIEIVYLCTNNFDFRKREIKLAVIKVSLNPNVSKLLFKLPEPNKHLEFSVVDSFLEAEGHIIYIV